MRRIYSYKHSEYTVSIYAYGQNMRRCNTSIKIDLRDDEDKREEDDFVRHSVVYAVFNGIYNPSNFGELSKLELDSRICDLGDMDSRIILGVRLDRVGFWDRSLDDIDNNLNRSFLSMLRRHIEDKLARVNGNPTIFSDALYNRLSNDLTP